MTKFIIVTNPNPHAGGRKIVLTVWAHAVGRVINNKDVFLFDSNGGRCGVISTEFGVASINRAKDDAAIFV